MERTLVLIKPDAVEQNVIGKILSFYEDAGLKIVAMRMEKATEEIAAKHYEEHLGREYYEPLMTFITRSPLVALVLEGKDAISKVREVNGKTNIEEQKEGTIRKAFAKSTRENCVHGSDSADSAKREMNLWFPELN